MANAHLEEKVRIKTTELERDLAERKRVAGELVQAKERAEESDRLKSAFLANISHEIRTPINGIIGFTNLLEKPNMNDEKRAKYTAIIKKSGKRLLDSINDLINMSRIEAGLIDVVNKDEDLNEITDDLFQFFAPEAKEKGLIDCICKACSASMNVLEYNQNIDIPLKEDMSGHPSMEAYIEKGYQIITL